MSGVDGLDKLLFELASQDRLQILRLLSSEPRKMNEVAKKLDLTATENFRQLTRLSDAKLIAKQPDATYVLTEYGKLVLRLLPALEVSYRNRGYFLDHDLERLPPQYLSRIGELKGASLNLDTIEIINKAAHTFAEAEKYVWAVGDRALESVGAAMAEGLGRGVKYRFMFHESLLPQYKPLLSELKMVEKRTLTQIPAMIFCSEKEAAVCLYSHSGRLDYGGFFGGDPAFVAWTTDLFLYYWDRASHCMP